MDKLKNLRIVRLQEIVLELLENNEIFEEKRYSLRVISKSLFELKVKFRHSNHCSVFDIRFDYSDSLLCEKNKIEIGLSKTNEEIIYFFQEKFKKYVKGFYAEKMFYEKVLEVISNEKSQTPIFKISRSSTKNDRDKGVDFILHCKDTKCNEWNTPIQIKTSDPALHIHAERYTKIPGFVVCSKNMDHTFSAKVSKLVLSYRDDKIIFIRESFKKGRLQPL